MSGPVPPGDGGVMVITFVYLSVHPFEDYLTIGVGEPLSPANRVLHLTGHRIYPRSATVNSSSLWIRFNPGPKGGFYGFAVRIQWNEAYGRL